MKRKESGMGMGFRAVAWAMVPGLAFLIVFQVARPLSIDDTHSTFHAFDGLRGVVDHLRSDSHPPLYFAFLAIWMQITGMGEIALRIPSIVFSLVGGLALWSYGRRSGDARLGVLFAVLFLFNPIVARHLHTVRPYALAGLLATLSTIAYLRLAGGEDSGERPIWWAYVIVNALGTLNHYWFFFLLGGQSVGALLSDRGQRRKLLLGIAASMIPFAVLWTPVLLEQMGGSPTSWMTTPKGLWLVGTPVRLLGGNFVRASAFYLIILAVCLFRTEPGPGLVPWPEVRRLLLDRRLWQLAAIPATVFVLAFAVSQIKPVYHSRYTIVASPAFAMFLGLILHRLADRRLAPLVPLAAILGSVAIYDRAGGLAADLERDNRAVAEFLIDQSDEGDELLHVTLNYAPTLHYLRALAPGRVFSQIVFPDDVAQHPGWRDVEAISTDSLALLEEARQVVRRLASRPDDVRIWLLADLEQDSALTQLLIDELDAEFALRRVTHMQAWWVSEVRLYESRGAPDAVGVVPAPMEGRPVRSGG